MPPPIPEKKNSSQTCYRLRRPVNPLRLSENSIRDREVGNYLFLAHARIQRGIGGPDPPPPRKITSYIGFYRNKDLHPPNPPPPQKKKKKKKNNNKKLHPPPPPPPPINVSTILNRKKYSCNKTPTKNTLIRVFFLLFESGRPRPLFLSARRGWRGGGGYYNIFIHTWARTILGFKILNFNTFEGFQKNEYFLGYEDFVDIFWGHHKTPKS